MKFFNKSSVPDLDTEAAGRILAQAFEASEKEHNIIPLDELIANSIDHQKRRFRRKAVFISIIVFIILTAVLWMASIPSSFTIQEQTSEHEFNPVYRIETDTFMLVDRVTVTINGRHIPVYETDSHVYTVEPSINGQMEVTVTLINGKSAVQYIDVTSVDNESPVAVSCRREGDIVYLYLSDAVSGIDYSSLHVFTLTGEVITSASIDSLSGCITFFRLKETINVSISDFAGNELQFILSFS